MKTTVLGLSYVKPGTSVCLTLKGRAARGVDKHALKLECLAGEIAVLNESRFEEALKLTP